MTRWTFIVAAALALHAGPALAQPARPADLTGAVTTTFAQNDYNVDRYTGFMIATTVPTRFRMAIVAELTADYRYDRFNDDSGFLSVMAGPRFARRDGTVRPFVQFPAGWGHSWTVFRLVDTFRYENDGFVFTPGAGLDVTIRDRWSVRVGEEWVVGSPWYIEAWFGYWRLRTVAGATYTFGR